MKCLCSGRVHYSGELNTVMRSVFVVCLVLGLCAVGIARDTGFQGKWLLDKNQSNATAAIPDGLEQQIKQKGSELVIQTRWREPKNGIAPLVLLGVMITELRLKVDGSQTNTQIGPFQAASTTKAEGNSMTTNWQAAINGQQITGQWTRTLSEDGKDMTLDIQQTSSEGKADNAKLVFRRR